MSTYRERREERAERLREWADKRETRASEVFERNRPITSDWAFITQPGHIPMRARIIAQEDRAFASLNKARDMTRRADGIEDQLAGSIYDDDPGAIERLTERIAALEAQRDQRKADNAAYRKAHKAELAAMTPYERCHAVPWPSYSLTNLSGNIKRNRDRLAIVTQRQERQEATEQAGGVLVETLTHGYARVTFSEKPERSILDALKAARFRWQKGSWFGQADALPESVKS